MNVLDSKQFSSKSRAAGKNNKGDGVSLQFMHEFITAFASRSLGMEISSINFEEVEQPMLEQDNAAVREIFELIYDAVNQPASNVSQMKENEELSI